MAYVVIIFFNRTVVSSDIKFTARTMMNRCRFKKLSEIKTNLNHLSFNLLYAFEQLAGYTEKTEAVNNNVVILNILCTPYGTNGKLNDNSGIKYLDRMRLEYDKKLLGNNDVSFLPDLIHGLIIDDLATCSESYQQLALQSKYLTKLHSELEFDYYIVTLAYSNTCDQKSLGIACFTSKDEKENLP